MSEMIDRVAKEIYDALGRSDPRSYLGALHTEHPEGDGPQLTTIDGRFDLRVIARAAIEAMREPDLAMRKVVSFRAAEVYYPVMIAAALGEPVERVEPEDVSSHD